MQTNSEIIQKLLALTGCENPNQLAAYLTDKYGITITRQQINQFQKSERLTITHLLLREFSENA
jgi:predicted transcriptional regulator